MIYAITQSVAAERLTAEQVEALREGAEHDLTLEQVQRFGQGFASAREASCHLASSGGGWYFDCDGNSQWVAGGGEV